MGNTSQAEMHPEKQLWELLDKVRAGLPGIGRWRSHMQPIAHLPNRDGLWKLWFFTGRSRGLFRELWRRG